MSVEREPAPLPPADVPPVVEPGSRPARERLGLAEWAAGLGLLLGSLTGPWLTLVLPAAVVFAVHDRRVAVRVAALALALPCVLLALAAPGGAVLVAMAVGALAASLAWIGRGRGAALGALAPPVLAGAGAGLALALVAVPGAVAAWEAMLRRGVAEGGAAALATYRDLGMDPEALAALETLLAAVADWTVRLWPGFAALALWLGAWLAWRLLARWGRTPPALAARLARRDFAEFAVGESVVWLLILGLGGLWVPPVARAAANAVLVGAILFALDGFAVVWWWFDRRGAGLVVRLIGLALALAFALPILAAAMILVGLADVWLQFRDRPRAARPSTL